jgi:hypothetical protein
MVRLARDVNRNWKARSSWVDWASWRACRQVVHQSIAYIWVSHERYSILYTSRFTAHNNSDIFWTLIKFLEYSLKT